MRRIASSIRHRTHARQALRLLQAAGLCVAALTAMLLPAAAHAQRPMDLGLTYTQQRTKFVGTSTNDYFRLRGATVDFNYELFHGLGVVASGNGMAATNQRESIDIHQTTFLTGVRYTGNYGHNTPTAWGRHAAYFLDAKVGYTFATSGIYPLGVALTNHASGLTYAGGAGIDVHLYHRLDLRLFQVEYVQTHLPNGGTNQQNNLSIAGGLNFHFGH
jgi:hypothetical protein